MTVKHRKHIILSIIVFLVLIIFGGNYFLLNNFKFLSLGSAFFLNTSKYHQFFINRMYKLSENEDIEEQIIVNMANSDIDSYVLGNYIRIMGVIGGDRSEFYLIKIFGKHQNLQYADYVLFNTVLSMGLSGSKMSEELLDRFISTDMSTNQIVMQHLAASSLYLLTGEQYFFINNRGEKEKLYLTQDLHNARDIIVSSKGRKRTYDEMITLDKLFQHGT